MAVTLSAKVTLPAGNRNGGRSFVSAAAALRGQRTFENQFAAGDGNSAVARVFGFAGLGDIGLTLDGQRAVFHRQWNAVRACQLPAVHVHCDGLACRIERDVPRHVGIQHQPLDAAVAYRRVDGGLQRVVDRAVAVSDRELQAAVKALAVFTGPPDGCTRQRRGVSLLLFGFSEFPA